MLKIKQSVKTLVSVAPRSVICREHCTHLHLEFRLVQRRSSLQQSLERGSSAIPRAWRASWAAVQFLVINTRHKLLHGPG